MQGGLDPDVVVREASEADAEAIGAIGRLAFPAVHLEIAGEEFVAAVVEQTYSIEAVAACIRRWALPTRRCFLLPNATVQWSGTCTTTATAPSLHRIYVDPEQKRGGIGSALIRTARPAGAGNLVHPDRC